MKCIVQSIHVNLFYRKTPALKYE